MFSKEEIALAKPCYEAIKKIAEKAKEECPKCDGRGWSTSPRSIDIKEKCPTCKGSGKVKGKWEWEPEEGDHIVLDDEVYLLFLTRDGLGYDAGISCGRSTDYSEEKCYDDFTQATKDNCIPLLHWERIEEILEGMGCSFDLDEYIGGNETIYYCDVSTVDTTKDNELKIERAEAKSRQLAVMRAVIELGKEASNEKD